MDEKEKKLLALLRASKDLDDADKKLLADLEAKEKATAPGGNIEVLEKEAAALHEELKKVLQGGRKTDDPTFRFEEMLKDTLAKKDAEHKAELEKLRKDVSDARLAAPTKEIAGTASVSKAMYNRMLELPDVGNHEIEAMKSLNDDLVLTATILSKCQAEKSENKESDTQYRAAIARMKRHPYFSNRIEALPANIKTLYTTGSTTGTELIPTDMSSDIIRRVDVLGGVGNQFPMIDMPTKAFDIPSFTSHSTMYILAEPTSDTDAKITASTPATTKVTLTAKTLGFRMDWTEEEEEDAVIALLPTLKEDGARAIAVGLEDAYINGDTTSPHMDADVTGSTDIRKAWIGLRKAASARSSYSDSLATFNAEAVRALRKTAGRYGVNPKDGFWVFGMSGYIQLLSLKDSSANPIVTTLDKFGSNATWLTGSLSAVDGAPVLVSEKIRENLNAAGVYDASTTTKTIALWVYRPGFVRGQKRVLTITMVPKPEYDKRWLIFTVRQDFQPKYGTSDKIVVGGVNLTS